MTLTTDVLDHPRFQRILNAFAAATESAEFGPAPEHRAAIRDYIRTALTPRATHGEPDALDDDEFTELLNTYASRVFRGEHALARQASDAIRNYARERMTHD